MTYDFLFDLGAVVVFSKNVIYWRDGETERER